MSSARNFRATSASSSRSRFFVNTVGTHTGSSTPRPDEPTIEQIVMQLFHQLAFRADGVERLQQKRPQQPLRRDRRSSLLRVKLRKFTVQCGKHFIDNTTDQPQRMVLGHSLFKIHIGKQFTRPYIRTAHRSLRYPPAQESDSPYNVSPAIEFFSSLLETVRLPPRQAAE